jgi:copper chaperone NosL
MNAKKFKLNTIAGIFLIAVSSGLLFSCNTNTQPLQLGKDNCDHCRMTISDARFGGELITAKGKVYKFDDLYCMVSFIKAGSIDTAGSRFYLVDFTSHQLQPAPGMSVLKSDDLRSPMNGNMAAFTKKEELAEVQKKFNGNMLTWNDALHIQ